MYLLSHIRTSMSRRWPPMPTCVRVMILHEVSRSNKFTHLLNSVRRVRTFTHNSIYIPTEAELNSQPAGNNNGNKSAATFTEKQVVTITSRQETGPKPPLQSSIKHVSKGLSKVASVTTLPVSSTRTAPGVTSKIQCLPIIPCAHKHKTIRQHVGTTKSDTKFKSFQP